MQYPGHGCQCISRARSRGNNLLLDRIIVTFVYTSHQRHISPFARRGYQHAFCSSLQVCCCLVGGTKDASSLDHQFNPEFVPGDIKRVEMRNDLDGSSVNDNLAVAYLHISSEGSIGVVKLEEISVDLGIPPIIDRHDVQVDASC